jgi:tryptophan synthase alpha chain
MNRYKVVFSALEEESRGALVPFLMIGELSDVETLQWVDMLVANGADALELGMPFSDPVADGPVIQQSSVIALEKGATPDSCFKLIALIRKKYPQLPLGLLTYANLVVARGIDRFYKDASVSGLDSVLLADIPAHAIGAFANSAQQNAILPILIAPPNATEQQLVTISRLSKGYTYVVSRAGVTGANNRSGFPADIISRLAQLNAPPSLLGFGIANGKDVKRALNAGCAGAICGSALVKIQQQFKGKERLLKGAELMQVLNSGVGLE